jgi:hypothetical protein
MKGKNNLSARFTGACLVVLLSCAPVFPAYTEAFYVQWEFNKDYLSTWKSTFGRLEVFSPVFFKHFRANYLLSEGSAILIERFLKNDFLAGVRFPLHAAGVSPGYSLNLLSGPSLLINVKSTNALSGAWTVLGMGNVQLGKHVLLEFQSRAVFFLDGAWWDNQVKADFILFKKLSLSGGLRHRKAFLYGYDIPDWNLFLFLRIGLFLGA